MRALIANNHDILFDNITEYEEGILYEQFSVSDPNLYVDASQLSLWDGVYRKYSKKNKRIARPFLSKLRSICKKFELPLDVVDMREPWDYTPLDQELINSDFLPGITLDEHQIKAIRKSSRVECGIIDVPTGGGKGEIICGICKANDCPTTIIADQRVVIDQLKRRLELRDIRTDIGVFYAGSRPSGQTIIVGSVQSLQTPPFPTPPTIREDEKLEDFKKREERYTNSTIKGYKTRKKNAKFLQDYVKRSEMIIVDECDKATSEPYKKLFKNYFIGRKRFGLSGTPFDDAKPVQAMVMQEHLGSVIASESRFKLVDIGRIITCDYTMMAIGPYETDSVTFDIAREMYMVNNTHLHNMIVGIARKYKDDGTLVLVERELLGAELVEAFKRKGIESHFIYGKTPKKRRDYLLRAFENRDFKVLIGGKIINRGLDLAGGCENLVIATGGKLHSEFEQKIGRALRKNKLGRSRVFDFFFKCNKHLYKHSKSRLEAMIRLKYDTRVVFPGGVIDGQKLVSGRYNIPRKYIR